MSGKFFLDSNVCVYAFDIDSRKKQVALDLSILYTEDMQHGHLIDNHLNIVNPFL